MPTVKESFATLAEQGTLRQENLVGCTESEIRELEAHFGCALPQAYKDFLLIAGKRSGKLFQGTDILYPLLLELKEWSRELLKENNAESLVPPEAVVFSMHQGYTFDYFLPGNNDPAIHQFMEGHPDTCIGWESFSEFISSRIADHLRVWPDLNDDEGV